MLAFLDMGFPEMVVCGLVALVLFGGQLPEVMRNLGATYRNFRRGMEDLKRQAGVDVRMPQIDAKPYPPMPRPKPDPSLDPRIGPAASAEGGAPTPPESAGSAPVATTTRESAAREPAPAPPRASFDDDPPPV